jgi:thiamine-phosphate pyrophosphorylase|tara:strand:+ start:658 stop:1212 length:555 start_codon:yes stop_codon:yes gene_type:complete
MHKNLPSFFTFIKVLKKEHIRKLDKKVAIIYRNYSTEYDRDLVLQIKKICKESGRKFYLSNNLKLAISLDLDGVYIPSFNKNLNIKKTIVKKKFSILGSAHSVKEIRIKEKQGVEMIFISPIFKTSKSKKFLNPIKFNLLALKTKKRVIALGGINSKNLNRLNIIKAIGFAGISYFKNNDKIKI